MAAHDSTVQLGGHRIRVSKLDKVLYPSTGTTKGDVIAYYSAIAGIMLPYCEGRPATRKRWPDGVGEDGTGMSFFQKDLGDQAPEWVHTGAIQHRDHVNVYPLVDDAATLVWLAQLAALEIHVPQWRFDASGTPAPPDRLVFDLDPGDGVSLRECAQIAFLVRDILRGMGLEVVPVTSGSSGIHLYAALDGSQSSEQASALAKELARSLEADHPDDITSSMKRALRPGKVFIDWSQNNAAKTTVAPYSLRGRAAPTVAAPRTWRELASPHVRQLLYTEVLDRVERRGDPLAGLLRVPRKDDRLSAYRAKRDARRTPEPVPEPGDDDAEGERTGLPAFVIQRHEARRLHFDFRIEHDGVLVSWALPKGVPEDPSVDHLAVPTEDHPLSYAHFEGVIPRGEYGAGTVRIWDAGECEVEKWRDDEVIVTLIGRPDGGLGGQRRRFALFRARESEGKPRWMIHLMKTNGTKTNGQRGAAPSISDSPMLAETGAEGSLPRLDPAEWAFEMKWDGIRALAFLDGEEVRIRSRSGQDLTAAYPELHGIAEVVNAEQAVLDGEIVALGPDGAPSFGVLQRRFGLTERGAITRARREAPAQFLVFDLLGVNGEDCRGLRYRQRRELINAAIEPSSKVPLAVPDVIAAAPEIALETSRRLGLEGVVAKRWDSVYRSGARSSDWRKFPFAHTEEAVVIGWRESSAESGGLASLLLAVRDEGELRYAGRVGTGFSARERREIRRRLARLGVGAPAVEVPVAVRRDAHWVSPALVCEVVSKGRTRTGSFRQAVWRGWRPDKSA